MAKPFVKDVADDGQRMRRQLRAALAVIVSITVTACSAMSSSLNDTRAVVTTVLAVSDGDSLRVDRVGRVRLIGIDAPETDGGCFAQEATTALRDLLAEDAPIRIVYDIDRSDRYGRTLAYVYRLEDDLFVNAELLRQGSARVLTVRPNVAHVAEFMGIEREARESSRGLWGACAGATG